MNVDLRKAKASLCQAASVLEQYRAIFFCVAEATYKFFSGHSILTHVVSNKTDSGAPVVISRCMGALDVPSSALVHVACPSHTETAKQGHTDLNEWLLRDKTCQTIDKPTGL